MITDAHDIKWKAKIIEQYYSEQSNFQRGYMAACKDLHKEREEKNKEALLALATIENKFSNNRSYSADTFRVYAERFKVIREALEG